LHGVRRIAVIALLAAAAILPVAAETIYYTAPVGGPEPPNSPTGVSLVAFNPLFKVHNTNPLDFSEESVVYSTLEKQGTGIRRVQTSPVVMIVSIALLLVISGTGGFVVWHMKRSQTRPW